MTVGQNGDAGRLRKGPLLVGAALAGAGGMLVLAGLAVGGAHLLSAAQHRVNEMEVPPAEIARLQWARAKAATGAGVSAWQNGATKHVAASS